MWRACSKVLPSSLVQRSWMYMYGLGLVARDGMHEMSVCRKVRLAQVLGRLDGRLKESINVSLCRLGSDRRVGVIEVGLLNGANGLGVP